MNLKLAWHRFVGVTEMVDLLPPADVGAAAGAIERDRARQERCGESEVWRVAQWDKVLRRVLSGRADANIPFDDLRGLLLRLGYAEHVKGDHHVFRKGGQREIIDMQPRHDGKAKAYQVRQIRAIFQTYGITHVS